MRLDCNTYLEEVKNKAREVVEKYKTTIGRKPPSLYIFSSYNKSNQTFLYSKIKHCIDCEIPVHLIDKTVRKGAQKFIAFNDSICLVDRCENFEKELDDLYNMESPKLIDIEYLRTNPNKVCAPAGVINMLTRKYNYNFEGKTAIIISRDTIIKKPLIDILLNLNVTTTIVNDKTNIQIVRDLCKIADFIFINIGIPKFLDDTFLNNSGEQVVIDFGVTEIDNRIMYGDLNELAIKNRVKYYISTPCGTELTTTAQLIENIADYYEDIMKSKIH